MYLLELLYTPNQVYLPFINILLKRAHLLYQYFFRSCHSFIIIYIVLNSITDIHFLVMKRCPIKKLLLQFFHIFMMHIIITILAEQTLSTAEACLDDPFISILFFDNSNKKIHDFINLLMQGHYPLKRLRTPCP